MSKVRSFPFDFDLDLAFRLVGELGQAARVPRTHGVVHCERVLENVVMAFAFDTRKKTKTRASENDFYACCLAGLLHNIDNPKYFGTMDYSNARSIVRKLYPGVEERMVRMIGYVGFLENENMVPDDIPHLCYLYPRWADRLESMGHVGVHRHEVMANIDQMPLYTKDTPRAYTIEEAQSHATAVRLGEYLHTGKSTSLMDHYYDKLLHLGDFESENTYIETQKAARMPVLCQQVVNWSNAVDKELSE